MKRILTLIGWLLVSHFALAQVTDATLTTENANEIKNKVYAPTRAWQFNQDLISSKASLLGTYSNPTWISTLGWSKLTGTPTTLSGYGITNGQPLSAFLTSISGLTPVNNDLLQYKSGAWANRTLAQYKSDLSLNLVENTALSTWAGSANITTLGTITSGAWSGTAIGATRGGTGNTTVTTGDLLYGSGSNTWGKLGAGTSGYVLTSGGAGVAPSWAVSASGVTAPQAETYIANGVGAVGGGILNEYDRRLSFPATVQHVAESWGSAVELPDGRIFLATVAWGDDFVDFSELITYGRYSSDGGKTWGNRFQIWGIEGSEILVAGAAIHRKANGTLQLYAYRQDNNASPIQTSLCRKESSDNGLTWGSTTVIFTGDYASPRSMPGGVLKLNSYKTSGSTFVSGRIGIPWSRWTGPGTSPDPYDYTSAYATYEGLYFYSDDDGVTWPTPVVVNALAGNMCVESTLTQRRNAGYDNTTGRLTIWPRMRGGFMGEAHSDNEGTTWSTVAATTLVADNLDQTVGYLPEADVYIATMNPITLPSRKRNEIWMSFNGGATWFRKYWLNSVPYSAQYYSSCGGFFRYKGTLIFSYFESNSDVTAINNYTYTIPIAGSIGFDQNAVLQTSSVVQGLTGTLTSGGGGLTLDKLSLNGENGIFNAMRVPTTTFQVSNTETGQFPIIDFWDNHAANTSPELQFTKTRSSGSIGNGHSIGTLKFYGITASGARTTGLYVSNSSTDQLFMDFITDQVGSTPVRVNRMLSTGHFLFGPGGNGIAPIYDYDVASFNQIGHNTNVNIINQENNSNYARLALAKHKGIGAYNFAQGQYVGVLDFGFGIEGVGSQIVAIANGDANGSYRANDITFWTTNGSAVNAERMRLTGAGKLLMGGTTSSGAAILELQSTTQAFMPPKMTTTQRDALTAVEGMMIYNVTTHKVAYYNGSAWVEP